MAISNAFLVETSEGSCLIHCGERERERERERAEQSRAEQSRAEQLILVLKANHLIVICDLQATGEDVPLIIRSCVRIINLYGERCCSQFIFLLTQKLLFTECSSNVPLFKVELNY